MLHIDLSYSWKMHCLYITDIVYAYDTFTVIVILIYYLIFYHFFIFLHLLELIHTAWQGSLVHPLQNDGQRIPCHGTLEEFLVCSQESLPSAHKLKV